MCLFQASDHPTTPSNSEPSFHGTRPEDADQGEQGAHPVILSCSLFGLQPPPSPQQVHRVARERLPALRDGEALCGGAAAAAHQGRGEEEGGTGEDGGGEGQPGKQKGFDRSSSQIKQSNSLSSLKKKKKSFILIMWKSFLLQKSSLSQIKHPLTEDTAKEVWEEKEQLPKVLKTTHENVFIVS